MNFDQTKVFSLEYRIQITYQSLQRLLLGFFISGVCKKNMILGEKYDIRFQILLLLQWGSLFAPTNIENRAKKRAFGAKKVTHGFQLRLTDFR